MNRKPKCIIVTGRPGSGKTTLSKQLAQRLRMPVISRDEIKEGYVNTFGRPHDQLPATTNGSVSALFFDIVSHYLTSKVSVIIEAAFQHTLWEPRIPKLLELSDLCMLICSVDGATAARRHVQRGLADPGRVFYHGDTRVAVYRSTGELGTPDEYVAPAFNVPTIHVLTASDYSPSVDEIVARL